MARMGNSMLRRIGGIATAAVAAGAVLVGCSSDGDDALDVFAAASLQDSFTELERQFEEQHPGVDVRLTFAGSSELVTQIEQGADADLIATANEPTMERLGELAIDPTIFATNTLVIITQPGNPLDINTFADLDRDGVTTVICAEEVPCGTATKTVEESTGVTLTPASEEPAVTGVVAKVTSGEADAGLVYVSDAQAAGDNVATVTDPAFEAVVNRYPIAVLESARGDGNAADFKELVLSQDGADVLEAAGLSVPND